MGNRELPAWTHVSDSRPCEIYSTGKHRNCISKTPHLGVQWAGLLGDKSGTGRSSGKKTQRLKVAGIKTQTLKVAGISLWKGRPELWSWLNYSWPTIRVFARAKSFEKLRLLMRIIRIYPTGQERTYEQYIGTFISLLTTSESSERFLERTTTTSNISLTLTGP